MHAVGDACSQYRTIESQGTLQTNIFAPISSSTEGELINDFFCQLFLFFIGSVANPCRAPLRHLPRSVQNNICSRKPGPLLCHGSF